jgi:peptidoglycan/xylan/chitin deacetylase (PgdA/CDA1 family)
MTRRSILRARGVILVYHRVAEEACDPWGLCVTPRHFDEHMDVLRRSARVVRLSEFASELGQEGTRPVVAITFDDGYADNVHAAQPILERHGLPATFFLVSGHVGGTREFWWDELDRILLEPGTLPARLELEVGADRVCADLNEGIVYSAEEYERNRAWRIWDDPPTSRHALYCDLWNRLRPASHQERERVLESLRAWSGIGKQGRPRRLALSQADSVTARRSALIEIGGHTRTHPRLAALTPAEQLSEIQGCRDDLEALTEGPIASFAYPYGGRLDYDGATIALVRETGFARACAVAVDTGSSLDPFQLPRKQVDDGDGESFLRRLSEQFPPLTLRERLARALGS